MDPDGIDTNSLQTPHGWFLGGIGVVGLLLAIIYIWAAVRIIRRSGYSGWWMLTALVPVLNIVMYLLFAFKKTPAQRELEQWRMQGSRY